MDDVSLKVFVGSIDFNATEDDIKEAFSPYGEVTHVVLLRDKETQKSRGFGFVTFKERFSVEAAIKGMNKQVILGRPIVVNYAEKKSGSGGGGGGGGAAAAAAGGANAASNNPGNFGSQQNYGYGYGQQQQGQQTPYFQGFPGQQGYGGWNQQGYNWGYWPQQGYGGWGQGWNQQMQQQYAQQAQQQQQPGQQQQQQGNNQGYNNNNSNYTNTSQSGY